MAPAMSERNCGRQFSESTGNRLSTVSALSKIRCAPGLSFSLIRLSIVMGGVGVGRFGNSPAHYEIRTDDPDDFERDECGKTKEADSNKLGAHSVPPSLPGRVKWALSTFARSPRRSAAWHDR